MRLKMNFKRDTVSVHDVFASLISRSSSEPAVVSGVEKGVEKPARFLCKYFCHFKVLSLRVYSVYMYTVVSKKLFQIFQK